MIVAPEGMTMLARPRSPLRLAVAAGMLFAASTMALALPDQLDESFGVHGTARIDAPMLQGLATLNVTDDGFVYGGVGCHYTVSSGRTGVFRLLPDGRLDASFGVDGFSGCSTQAMDAATLPVIAAKGPPALLVQQGEFGLTLVPLTERGTIRAEAIVSLARPGVPALGARTWISLARRDAHGRLVVAGLGICGDLFRCAVVLLRYNADGTLDRGFGDGGIAHFVPDGDLSRLAVADFAIHADDRITVALDDGTRMLAARLLPDGRLDPRFAFGGITWLRGWGTSHAVSSIVVQPDGAVILGGSMRWSVPGYGNGVGFAVRFNASGWVDLAFGNQGIVTPRTLGNAARVRLALQPDGKLLVAGIEQEDVETFSGRLFVARFDTNGAPDLHFGGAGFASLRRGSATTAVHVAVGPEGRILVADAIRVQDATSPIGIRHYPVVHRLEGGNAPLPRPFREARAIEYFHAQFGHYFVTALDTEIENLDLHAPGGWARTGRTFSVWSHTDAQASPVCRFFSDQAFAPRSSHFYTSYAAECESLKRGSAWKHEGTAFYLRQPVGAPGAGACPSGSRPLYRAYNNGRSGAPNHRYTIEPTVLDDMIAQGWTFEGEADTRIFACVPLLQ
jgi:uncharacterized delta-60 repeat protein